MRRPTSTSSEGGTRLQKLLARAGVASRRGGEELIRQGKVTVNGRTVTEMGLRVDPRHDRITVEGRRLPPPAAEPERHVLLHKPRGVITTRRDPRGRKTVYGLLDESAGPLIYVGRLDRDAEGLLLFTSDGELAHRLTHPSYEVAREYRVLVEGAVDDAFLRRGAREGVELEDGRTAAFEISGAGREWRIVLREGKSHEVKRIFAAAGGRVARLLRVRLGPLELGDLRSGRTRPLAPREVRALRRAVRLTP
ncbi:MAG: pseudouridine synthase [Gemmatimonadota bacterium]